MGGVDNFKSGQIIKLKEDVIKLIESHKKEIEENRFHYESLIDCGNKILKSVDEGKVPKIGILGLRILLDK